MFLLELVVVVFLIVFYVWSCKRKLGVRKYILNVCVIFVVFIELFDINKVLQDIFYVLVFNSGIFFDGIFFDDEMIQ